LRASGVAAALADPMNARLEGANLSAALWVRWPISTNPACAAASDERLLALCQTPQGHLLLAPSEDAPELEAERFERIERSFARGRWQRQIDLPQTASIEDLRAMTAIASANWSPRSLAEEQFSH